MRDPSPPSRERPVEALPRAGCAGPSPKVSRQDPRSARGIAELGARPVLSPSGHRGLDFPLRRRRVLPPEFLPQHPLTEIVKIEGRPETLRDGFGDSLPLHTVSI